jgi:hypothetical protein
MRLLVLSTGCLLFLGNKAEPPRTPAAVQRFAAAALSLGIPPSPAPLPETTRLLAFAVESLPNAPGARDRGREIEGQAQAMHADDAGAARRSVELALTGLGLMRKPAGSKSERERAVAAVRRAVGVTDSYQALAHALVLFTGGPAELASGASLSALVARFAVEDDQGARRAGAQAVLALADELRDAGGLRKRAERLAQAEPLGYAPELRDALEHAVGALGKLRAGPAWAPEAVQRIARDRPFELQRPAAQDAFRLVADALTVAAGAR